MSGRVSSIAGTTGGDGPWFRAINVVMAGLVPAIHVFAQKKTWMSGTRPGMTVEKALIRLRRRRGVFQDRLPPRDVVLEQLAEIRRAALGRRWHRAAEVG